MRNSNFRKTLDTIPQETKMFVRIYADILKYINYLLEIKGYKQKDLARQLGKQESEISKWLNGEHNLTIKTIAKLQTALGEPIITVPSIPESYTKVWKKDGVTGFSTYVEKKPKTKTTDEFEIAEISTKPEQKPQIA